MIAPNFSLASRNSVPMIKPSRLHNGLVLRPPSPPSTRVAERAVTEDVTKTPALDSSFR